MSGTSLDSIDWACVSIDQKGSVLHLSIRAHGEHAWPVQVRDRLERVLRPDVRISPADLGELSIAAGDCFAEAVMAAVEATGLMLGEVDLVASHGQTIHHAVDPVGRVRSTVQVGQPAVIAERTGCTVAADFRPRDIAAQGQGAPLVSFVDALLLGSHHEHRAVQNLGGIANVTFVPAASPRDAIAFDTGPGNVLLDALARLLLSGARFDRDGQMAGAGHAVEGLVTALINDPFFRRPPPRSADREQFGGQTAEWLIAQGRERGRSDADLFATAARFTARSIAEAYRDYMPEWPERVLLSGGGGANPTLVRMLAEELRRVMPVGREVPVLESVERHGLPQSAKEAICFAVLGHETLHGRPNSLPGCTGARHAASLGAIWPGDRHARLLERIVAGANTPIERIELVQG